MALQGFDSDFSLDDPLGADLLSDSDDLDPAHRFESGISLLVHDLYWRLSTPRGRLLEDPNYGLDIAEELCSQPLTPSALAAFPRRVEGECRKEARVGDGGTVIAILTQGETPYAFRLTIRGTSISGQPFELVIGVAQAATKILESS